MSETVASGSNTTSTFEADSSPPAYEAPPSASAASSHSSPESHIQRPELVQTQLGSNVRLNNVADTVSAIKNSPYFVGNPALVNLVKWQAQSNNYILVRKDNEEEAELEWFGEIDARLGNFSLYIDGGWKPEYKTSTPFHTAKGRALVIKPSRNAWEPAAEQWDNILKGFKMIQTLKKSQGAKPQNMIVVENDTSIKVRHIIFEAIKKDVDTADADIDTNADAMSSTAKDDESERAGDVDEGSADDDDSPFLMKNWICGNPEAKAELNAIINTGDYHGNILPAYSTTENDLIPPAQYEYRLRGALVSFKTAVTYQRLGGKLNSDNYYAEIREIKVISPPPPPPPSPSKKRLREAQDFQNRKRKAAT